VEIFDKLLNIDVTESNDLLRKVERLNLGETIKLCNRLRLTHQKEEQIRIESIVEAIDNLPSVNKAQNNEAKTSFDHIGGYEQLKQKLREVFLWPMQFSDIYKSVGIRIGNGAILYGPSGCGKTLIARGLASEIGLNVIHIKVGIIKTLIIVNVRVRNYFPSILVLVRKTSARFLKGLCRTGLKTFPYLKIHFSTFI
jgi:ATP-dependent 26S proteasome regulatory subunit